MNAAETRIDWTPAMDGALVAAVKLYAGEQWAKVAVMVGSSRTGDSCRLHWRVLEPDGCTVFHSRFNSNMLTHPARRQAPAAEQGSAFSLRAEQRGVSRGLH